MTLFPRDEFVESVPRRGRWSAEVFAQAGTALDRASALAQAGGIVLLRASLALVFLWFGALKIAGRSPVFNLVHATLPWWNPYVVVPALGVVEVLLGLALLLGLARRVVLLGLAAHLTGTFLTFVDAPGWVFRHSDPLLLTANGEFVLKNLVLISAALVLVGAPSGRGGSPGQEKSSGGAERTAAAPARAASTKP